MVYGVRGLSVVDASMMPTIVAGTTSMTVYAVAEKVRIDLDFFLLNLQADKREQAADLIKLRAGTIV